MNRSLCVEKNGQSNYRVMAVMRQIFKKNPAAFKLLTASAHVDSILMAAVPVLGAAPFLSTNLNVDVKIAKILV